MSESTPAVYIQRREKRSMSIGMNSVADSPSSATTV